MGRGTVFGEVTRGGANPGQYISLDDQLEVFIPHVRAINPVTQSNWEGHGVIPDLQCSEKDALLQAQVQFLDTRIDGEEVDWIRLKLKEYRETLDS